MRPALAGPWLALALTLAPGAVPRLEGAQNGAIPAPASSPPAPALDPGALERVRRALDAPSIIRDAIGAVPDDDPTFRVAVTERPFNIWAFWGEPDTAVSPAVRWVGGGWHQEFKNMVTPDAFKGFGGTLGNGERLQLVATQVAFAAAVSLARAGLVKAREAAQERERERAREEVRAALEAFFREHPEARPSAPEPVP